jgi:hypothetical protein
VLAIRDSYHYIPRDSSVNWGMGQASSSEQQPSMGSQVASYASAISALVGVGIAIANLFKGCGQSCIQATSIVTQAQSILAQMLATYVSTPVRYASVQAAALATFDSTWQYVLTACGNPQLGAAGQHCITDRQAGACVWKASPGSWNADGSYTSWGPAGSGTSCWNWFSGIRDMIANDPFVQPDPVPATTTNAILSGSSPDLTELLIGAALLAAAVLL